MNMQSRALFMRKRDTLSEREHAERIAAGKASAVARHRAETSPSVKQGSTSAPSRQAVGLFRQGQARPDTRSARSVWDTRPTSAPVGATNATFTFHFPKAYRGIPDRPRVSAKALARLHGGNQEVTVTNPRVLAEAHRHKQMRDIIENTVAVVRDHQAGTIERGYEKRLIPEGTRPGTVIRAYKHAALHALHKAGLGAYDTNMDEAAEAELTPLVPFIRYAHRRVFDHLNQAQLKGKWTPFRDEFGQLFRQKFHGKYTGKTRMRMKPTEFIKIDLDDELMKLERRDDAGRWTGIAGAAAGGLGLVAIASLARKPQMWANRTKLAATIRDAVTRDPDIARDTKPLALIGTLVRNRKELRAHASDLINRPVAIGKSPTGKQLRRHFARQSYLGREASVLTDERRKVISMTTGTSGSVDMKTEEHSLTPRLRRYHNHPVDFVPSSNDRFSAQYLDEKRLARNLKPSTNIIYGHGTTSAGRTRVRVTRHDGGARPKNDDEIRELLASKILLQTPTAAIWEKYRKLGSNYRTKAVEKMFKPDWAATRRPKRLGKRFTHHSLKDGFKDAGDGHEKPHDLARKAIVRHALGKPIPEPPGGVPPIAGASIKVAAQGVERHLGSPAMDVPHLRKAAAEARDERGRWAAGGDHRGRWMAGATGFGFGGAVGFGLGRRSRKPVKRPPFEPRPAPAHENTIIPKADRAKADLPHLSDHTLHREVNRRHRIHRGLGDVIADRAAEQKIPQSIRSAPHEHIMGEIERRLREVKEKVKTGELPKNSVPRWKLGQMARKMAQVMLLRKLDIPRIGGCTQKQASGLYRVLPVEDLETISVPLEKADLGFRLGDYNTDPKRQLARAMHPRLRHNKIRLRLNTQRNLHHLLNGGVTRQERWQLGASLGKAAFDESKHHREHGRFSDSGTHWGRWAAGIAGAGLVAAAPTLIRGSALKDAMAAMAEAHSGQNVLRGTTPLPLLRTPFKGRRELPAHARDLVRNPVAVGKTPTGKELRRHFLRHSLNRREAMVVTDKHGKVTYMETGKAVSVGGNHVIPHMTHPDAARFYHNHPIDAAPSVKDAVFHHQMDAKRQAAGLKPLTNYVYSHGYTPAGKIRTRISRFDRGLGASERSQHDVLRHGMHDIKPGSADSRFYEHIGDLLRRNRQWTEKEWKHFRATEGSKYRTKAVEKRDFQQNPKFGTIRQPYAFGHDRLTPIRMREPLEKSIVAGIAGAAAAGGLTALLARGLAARKVRLGARALYQSTMRDAVRQHLHSFEGGTPSPHIQAGTKAAMRGAKKHALTVARAARKKGLAGIRTPRRLVAGAAAAGGAAGLGLHRAYQMPPLYQSAARDDQPQGG